MKKIIFITLFFGFLLTVHASNNLYAPTLKDVVVLYDMADGAYSPHLFHWIMGEVLDMHKDATCPYVRVDLTTVSCLQGNKRIPVGKMGPKVGQRDFWAVLSVQWFKNVAIKENKDPKTGSLYYSLVVLSN